MTTKQENLIVFDWNGTILSDASAWLRAINAVLKELGTSHITTGEMKKHYKMPLVSFYEDIGVPPETLKERHHELLPLLHTAYIKEQVRLRRGAKTMLQAVRKTSRKSVILSNHMTDHIEHQAQTMNVRKYLDEILAFNFSDGEKRNLGKIARLKDYISQRPFSTGAIVGDTEEEIYIGQELGLATIAITEGMCSTSRLRKTKPDFLVSSLSQIPDIANHLFGDARLTA